MTDNPSTDELLDWRHRHAAHRDYLIKHRAEGVELLGVVDGEDVPAGVLPEVWASLSPPRRRRDVICGRLLEVDADIVVTGAAIDQIDHLLAGS